MLRSSLAMLGIIIGVVAIASMGILGNSMVQVVSASLSSVGDCVIVTPYSGGGGEWFWRRWWRELGKPDAHRPELPADQTRGRPERGDSCSFDIGAHESGCRKRRHCGNHLRNPDGPDQRPAYPTSKQEITTTGTPAASWDRHLQRIIMSRSVRGFPSEPMGNTARSGLRALSRSGG